MSIEAQYQVYHDLETAEARMLLPLKVGQFPVLHNDLSAVSETAATDDLPICVGVDQVPCMSLHWLRHPWELVMLHPVMLCSACSACVYD
jgi:hypothetical protein